jgi:putative transposase
MGPVQFVDGEGLDVYPHPHIGLVLENYYLPGDLEAQIEAFVAGYNHLRYHESIGNLTPADVYFGRDQTILIERERIKRQTIANRRLMHSQQAA